MRVLLVDDEKEIIIILKDYFEANGHIVAAVLDGNSALSLFSETKYDIIILDVMLPDIEGTEVCRIIRNTSSVPILMLSAKDTDMDQILGLGLGADEYATKPFSPSVILAKAKALVRRNEGIKGIAQTDVKGKEDYILHYGKIYLDSQAHIVKVDQQIVNLSPKEFELLHHLMRNINRVYPKQMLFDLIWG
ncbi:MAG: response regulator transcription factor, partial [Clostridiales bacterium]|nr:response regulator transcription factor [Clostridiales bacterium]